MEIKTLEDSFVAAAALNVREITIGIVSFTASIVLFALYSMVIKLGMSNYGLSVSELVYTVSLLVVPLFYLTARYNNIDVFAVPGPDQKYLFARCVSGCTCDILMFLSFQYTTYSKGFCLFFTCTLFSPFLAAWLIKEPIRLWDIIGIIFGFTGMLLLVQPWK